MPDFSRPGEDGGLPEDFREWERSVTFTASPEMLSPLAPHRELLLNVTARRITSLETATTDYSDLYDRAIDIAHARAVRVTSTTSHTSRRTRIVAQGWFSNEAGRARVDSASVTLGLTFLPPGIPSPAGEAAPERAELRAPSKGDPRAFAARHLDERGAHRLHELYIDFVRSDTRDVTVSYGEYVDDCASIDFAPILARAEALATFHAGLAPSTRREVSPQFMRREWNCLATGKSDGSQVATVHLYFRLG